MSPHPSAATVTADLTAGEQWAEAWCRGLDPDTWHGSDAASAAERLAVVIRRLEAAQLRLAHRAEACSAHAARARSGAGWLAGLNGSTVAEARRALELAGRLEACPAAAQALIDGELSVEKTAAVTEAAVLDPGAERRLVDKAKRSDLFETRAEADKIKQASRCAEDEAVRHARLRRGRSWRVGKGPEGHTEVRALFVPAEFAQVKPVLDAFMKIRVADAHDRGERDSYDAYAADAALTAIKAAGNAVGIGTRPTAASGTAASPSATSADASAEDADRGVRPPGPIDVTATTGAARAGSSTGATTSTGATRSTSSSGASGATDTTSARLFDTPAGVDPVDGLDPKIDWSVVILVDGIALKRGYAAPGETCEIPGVGTIPVSWIHQLLPTAQAEMLIHDSVDIRAYATTTRHRTRPVDLGVRVRDRDCNAGPCHHPISEIDHRTPYADTHDTSMANLGGLCHRDHDDKTYRGGVLERDDTNWHWWPPGTDPRSDPPETKPIGRHLTPWNLDHPPVAEQPKRQDSPASTATSSGSR